MLRLFAITLCLGVLSSLAVVFWTPSCLGPCKNAPVSACVMITAQKGFGSGVVFRNGDRVFVWTAAHVLTAGKRIERIMTKDGEFREVIKFSDVVITQDIVHAGRKAGYIDIYAKVIRYSDHHDLAILEAYANQPRCTTRFNLDAPVIGEPLWHVGSMHGTHGSNSVSLGVLAAIGRLRTDGAMDEQNGVVYDQVSITCHPGSSGGGIFRPDGTCVGIITEFLGPNHTFGALCYVPARRLQSFSREANCEWAFDSRIPVPAEDKEPVYQDATKLP